MTSKKPIRKGRVLLVVLVALAAILTPLLLRSRGGLREERLEAATAESSFASSPNGTEVSAPEASPAGTSETEKPLPVKRPLILQHVVKQGETLVQIASLLGVSAGELMADNRLLSAEALRPGMTLRASRDGILHRIKSGQTLTDISLTYGVPVAQIAEKNGIADPQVVFAGEEIVIPRGTSSIWKSVVRLSRGQEVRFIRPVEGEVVAGFGWRVHPVLGVRDHHNGIDFDVPIGTPVHAAAMGLVYFVGDQEGPGTLIILEHADGYYTAYGHLSKTLVHVGQFVEMGQPIAESGNTGISSGPHLHFEVRNQDFPADPLRYLP